MATWGEFIKDFKITNMKGTVYIHADQVLDVWEERNNLRQEAATLREEATQLKEDLAQERERCAQDVDEFAEAIAAEGDQPEYLVTLLQAVAGLIRDRGKDAEDATQGHRTDADMPGIPSAEEVPMAEMVDESVPTADSVAADAVASGDIPTAKPVPRAEKE